MVGQAQHDRHRHPCSKGMGMGGTQASPVCTVLNTSWADAGSSLIRTQANFCPNVILCALSSTLWTLHPALQVVLLFP